VKVTKSTSTSVEGTIQFCGAETNFVADINGKVSFEVQGPAGFAVLDFVRNFEAGLPQAAAPAPTPTPTMAAPTSAPEPAKRGRKPKEAAPEPAATTPEPEPTPEAQPQLPLVEPAKAAAPAPAEEDPSAYIDTPASRTDTQAKMEAAQIAAAQAAPQPAASAVAAAAAGTEANIDPAAEGPVPAHVAQITDWPTMMPAIVAWAVKKLNIKAGASMDSALEQVVALASQTLPTLPIGKGAAPNNFAPNILKVMLRKPVQSALAGLAA